jgi:hypothetical protein
MSARLPSLALILFAFAGIIAPQSANAKAFGDEMGGETFDSAATVSDTELSTMRGGFLSVNGLLINFNFFSNVQVGIDTISNVSINTENLAQAALTANQIQDLLQPHVIQNMDDNVLISVQQLLDLNIINVGILNQAAQLEQLQYQQVIN